MSNGLLVGLDVAGFAVLNAAYRGAHVPNASRVASVSDGILFAHGPAYIVL